MVIAQIAQTAEMIILRFFLNRLPMHFPAASVAAGILAPQYSHYAESLSTGCRQLEQILTSSFPFFFIQYFRIKNKQIITAKINMISGIMLPLPAILPIVLKF